MKVIRKKQVNLSEIPQSMGNRYAILVPKTENELLQVTPTVKCRDFLCDVYSSGLQGVDFSIYGMSWNGTVDKVPMDRVRLLVSFPSEEIKKDFITNLALLHTIEKHNGITLTEIAEIDESTSPELVVIGDAMWLGSVLLFSLYTFLLRVLCYKHDHNSDWIEEFSNKSFSDSRYMKDCPRETLNRVLNDLRSLVFPLNEWNGLTYAKDGTGRVHHNSGFVSVFSRHGEIRPDIVKQNSHYQHFVKLGWETCIK